MAWIAIRGRFSYKSESRARVLSEAGSLPDGGPGTISPEEAEASEGGTTAWRSSPTGGRLGLKDPGEA